MRHITLILCLTLVSYSIRSQGFNDPELLVKALYEEVTFSPGEAPDWELAKSMLLITYFPYSTLSSPLSQSEH